MNVSTACVFLWCNVNSFVSAANEGCNDYHPMFFTHERAWEEFFCVCIQLLNKTWKEMRATAEDFNKVSVCVSARGQTGCSVYVCVSEHRVCVSGDDGCAWADHQSSGHETAVTGTAAGQTAQSELLGDPASASVWENEPGRLPVASHNVSQENISELSNLSQNQSDVVNTLI